MAYKKSNPNGQATMANSEPVVIASDQSAVPVSGTFFQATQPVSAASLPLPTDASTSAKQDTIIGHVDGIETVLGTIDTDTGAIATSTASIDTKTPALGQALAAASVPVVLTAAQVSTLTPPAAITNFANETGGNLAAIKAKTDNIPAQGQALAAASLPVVLTAAQVTTLTPQTNALTDTQLRATAVPVSGTVTANLAAGTNNIGDVDVLSIAAGTNYIGKVRVTDGTTDSEIVPLAGYNAQAVAIVDASGNQITSFGGGTQYTDDSAFTLGSGTVTAQGHGIVAYGTNPDVADAGDVGIGLANRHRIPFVIGGHPNIVTLEYAASATAKTNDPIITIADAAGGGGKIVVTQIQVINDSLSPNIVDFRIGFATATTPTTTGVVATHPAMIPGSIYTRGDGSGILGVGGDGEDLRITSADPGTGGEIRVLVSYYTITS